MQHLSFFALRNILFVIELANIVINLGQIFWSEKWVVLSGFLIWGFNNLSLMCWLWCRFVRLLKFTRYVCNSQKIIVMYVFCFLFFRSVFCDFREFFYFCSKFFAMTVLRKTLFIFSTNMSVPDKWQIIAI